MKISDQRPMPTAVLAAYRDPLNLKELLASSIFTDGYRVEVRDELLKRLIDRYGNVDVEIGKANTLPVHKRVAQFGNNVWSSIEMLLQVEEFGVRAEVLLDLAAIMQPYWARWWELIEWKSMEDIDLFFRISSFVIGQRQMVWLAAQYARFSWSLVKPFDRQVCMNALEAAEAWAIVPSEDNRYLAAQAADDAHRAGYAAFIVQDDTACLATYAFSNAARATANRASYTADADRAPYAADAASASAAANTTVYAYARASDATCSAKLCALTKRLVTPTLITSPYRGLR